MMFVKQLWKYNKLYAASFVGFVLLFLFINAKQGITIAPVYEYGMFSAKFSVKDTQKIITVIINKTDTLDFTKLDYMERDQLLFPIEKLHLIAPNNEQVYNTMKQVFSKFGCGFLINQNTHLTPLNGEEIATKIVAIIKKYLKTDIIQLQIEQQQFCFINNAFIPVSNPQIILTIGAE